MFLCNYMQWYSSTIGATAASQSASCPCVSVINRGYGMQWQVRRVTMGMACMPQLAANCRKSCMSVVNALLPVVVIIMK